MGIRENPKEIVPNQEDLATPHFANTLYILFPIRYIDVEWLRDLHEL